MWFRDSRSYKNLKLTKDETPATLEIKLRKTCLKGSEAKGWISHVQRDLGGPVRLGCCELNRVFAKRLNFLKSKEEFEKNLLGKPL